MHLFTYRYCVQYFLFVFVVLQCVYADIQRFPNILLISGSRSSSNMLTARDKRTKNIFWDEVEERNTTNLLASSYDLVVSEVSKPLLLLLKVSKARLVYVSPCTHFVLPMSASGRHDITACGPKLSVARKLDMVLTLSTETASALVKLGVKAKFYPNWSFHSYNFKYPQVENLVSQNCHGRGIFVSFGSSGGRKSRDMHKMRKIIKMANSHDVTSAICTYHASPVICKYFDICEHCDETRYIEVLKCMRILVLPLHPLQNSPVRESGRGLRTIISGLENGVTIITTDTPYMRDYLSNYNCAFLLPESASAKEYWKYIQEALRSVNTKLCSLNAYNHSFNAETALPRLLDMLTSELLPQSYF